MAAEDLLARTQAVRDSIAQGNSDAFNKYLERKAAEGDSWQPSHAYERHMAQELEGDENAGDPWDGKSPNVVDYEDELSAAYPRS